jgi:6-phosphogluconolactonase (cycloisomerase 2 family)
MKVEVEKYRKPDGYATRYWSVVVDGELLAVTLYRKGAVAVARAITNSNQDPHVTTLQDSAEPYTITRKPAAGVATDGAR